MENVTTALKGIFLSFVLSSSQLAFASEKSVFDSDRGVLKLSLSGIASAGSEVTRSIGAGTGFYLGANLSNRFRAGLFLDLLGTLSTAGYGSINLGQTYGLQADYLLPISESAQLDLGVKAGRMEVSGVQMIIIPIGTGTLKTWIMGPTLGLDFRLSKLFSIGTNIDVLYALPTLLYTNSVFSKDRATERVNGFLVTNLTLSLGFHI